MARKMTIREILESEGRSTEPTKVITSEATGAVLRVFGEIDIETFARGLYRLPARKVKGQL